MLARDTLLDLKSAASETLKPTPAESHLNLHIADKEDSKLECWTELKVKDRFINKRSYHAAVVHKSKLYVYGGQDLNIGNYSDFNVIQLNEELTLSQWDTVITKTKVSPGPLARMMSIYDDDKWYLFGGTTNATENTSNLWCFDFTKSEWTLIKPSSTPYPPSLDSHSGGLYKSQGKTYIVSFGGFVGGSFGEYWNQVIKYDIAGKKWILPYKDAIQFYNPDGPSPRGGHTASIFDGNMFVFGGTNCEVRFSDIWKYDLNQDTWQKIKTKLSPPPRNGHTSLIHKNQGIIIFGGIQDITHEKDDLLFFSFITNQWTVLDGEYDHSKVTTLRNNERAETLKIERSNRGKSLTESPVKSRTSNFNSRMNTKGFDQSPSKRTNTRGFQYSRSPSRRATSPDTNSKDGSPNRYGKLPSANSFALSQSEMRSTASPAFSRPYQGLTKENEEKRKRLFLIRKTNFLKTFEVTDPNEASILTMKSPTTEAMKNSIIALNYKGQQPDFETTTSGQSQSQSPLKGRKKNPVTIFGDLLADSFIKVKIPVNGKLTGRKPCARDGHTSVLYGNQMIVFGGDRHKMSFNDLYTLNIKQIIAPTDREAL